MKKPPNRPELPHIRQRTVYTQRSDYEDFNIKSGEIFKFSCCDCGLVHKIVAISKRKGIITMAALRDNRATAQRRRRILEEIVK